MGKRELVIALVFAVAGVLAYQVAAPAPKPGERGLSFSRFWENARREIRGNPARATARSTGRIPVSPRLQELRVEGVISSGRLDLEGSARSDIEYELDVESSGPDETTAREFARRVTMTQDDLVSALTLRVSYPPEYRQRATVTVRLPSRLKVFVTGAGGSTIANVRSADLDGISGDWTLSRIAEDVTGSHRNGSLTGTDVGAVRLELHRTRASFERVGGPVNVEVHDGEFRAGAVKGLIEVEQTSADVTIANASGPVRVLGSEGQVTVIDPAAESKVDVRRAEVDVRLSAAVPLTLLTTNALLRLTLQGPPAITLDAIATQGRIDAEEFGLRTETTNQDSRLMHTFGGGARVSLRNSRGAIVIRKFSPEAIVNPDRK